jgi:hypothetical protein
MEETMSMGQAMKIILDFLFFPAILGAAFFGLCVVIALLTGSESFLLESTLYLIPCIAIIAFDSRTFTSASTGLDAPKLKPKPKSLPQAQPADLAHLKEGILKTAETGPLSYSRLMSILDNRHRFGFSDDEVQKLESSRVTGPFPEAPVKPAQVCARCGGSGYLREYSHIEGGRCFSCNPG